MTPPTLLTQWARLLLGCLREAGIRDVVLSPGSRNTPFTWAALQDPGLRCRTVVDERSAAFFAAGHARITGRPVLLVCTSGSAAANYFPAVVEAAESGTPLVVLTADRPLELQHAAAPQTIDQTRIYGAFARAYFDLGTPDPATLEALPRLAAQAVLAATDGAPGPVHINARARKPLEPVDGDSASDVELRHRVDLLLDAVPRADAGARVPPPEAVRDLADACRAAQRGLIVCGPAAPWRAADPARVAALATASGFPVVAETASQQRLAWPGEPPLLDAFEALLAIPAFRESAGPDLILQLGRPPTASAWNPYLQRWPDARRWLLTADGWPDPWNTAAGLLRGDVNASLDALTRALDGHSPEGGGGWRHRLGAANAAARGVLDADERPGLTEPAAVRELVDALPDGGVLALGNSLPIREADLVARAGARGIAVWSQRGANGIDGLISGAAGAAAAADRPTALLLGDVSFAHDIGGLAVARGAGAPLAIVVLNNGGGRIFDRLPIAVTLGDDPAMEAWRTPTGLDIAAAAEAYGVGYVRITDRGEVAGAVREALGAGGVTVVEVMIGDEGPVAQERALLDRIQARLAR